MQPLRTTFRRLPRRIIVPAPSARIHTTPRNMSLFPRFQEFSPLFRMLDDYDKLARNMPSGTSAIRAFSPKFDVREVKDAYELHGELPGIAQKDVNIEWSDANTLTISGHTEHHRESGEPPRGFVTEEGHHEYHKPTVEDAPEAEGSKQPQETAVTKTDENKEVAGKDAQPKYWVTERSVGEFHRSFSFPGRVDHDNVKASLKDGILSIVVPKASAPKPRRINIE
ncbi:HSP20-like chaperone [Lineolata rhizophorae]|uniref:HSP20-like chaperone n=1 Tax=Lineolata rhizophorae TaxID=578093 RepID=A0A6A6NYY2_9PEZI|nr:HSP20-like chaperone [Lineolata rhizophorae]